MTIDYEAIALAALTEDPTAKEWWDQARAQAKPYDPGGLLTMLAITNVMKIAALAAARAIKREVERGRDT